MDIIKGSDLMLFVKEGGNVRSLAFATSHTFTISADTADISSKDHGFWGGKEITRITWNIQSDNLYTVKEFNTLYTSMIARTPVEVYFCLKSPSERAGVPATVNLPGDTYSTWTPTTASGEDGYYGRAYITSLTANAAAGDNATFSVTLDGIGAIAQGLMGSVESSIGGSGQIVVGTTTYERATSYAASTQYYVYTNGVMVAVDGIESSSDFSSESSKVVLYKVATNS